MAAVVEVVTCAGNTQAAGAVSALAEAVMDVERLSGAVVIAFVDEETIAGLNARYRDVSGPTDVLAFRYADDLSGWPGQLDEHDLAPGRAVDEGSSARADAGEHDLVDLGELAVCPAVVRRYAAEADAAPEAVLGWTIVHGMLHLAGYDHETDDGEMRQREWELLRDLEQLLTRIQMPDRARPGEPDVR